METDSKEWKIKAITDIWTGDYQQKNERLITTGLLGSIRWWFEVLVRGLGGSACDPTVDGVRCPDSDKKNPLDKAHHCVVCELFGCTGWARKFRLMVLSEDGNVINGQIKANTTFVLRFIPLRPISNEEWCLLDATLRLIADYGAIGGKTVYKPSDEQGRANLPHHRDYGIIECLSSPTGLNCARKTLEDYVHESRWRHVEHSHIEKKDGNNIHHDFSWASLQNFWCVKNKYLKRKSPSTSTFNEVLGRDQRKTCTSCGKIHKPMEKCKKSSKYPQRYSDRDPRNQPYKWLAGSRQESKKMFSFANPKRTFGFVNPSLDINFQDVKKILSNVFNNLDTDFLEGKNILNSLLPDQE